MSDVVEKAEKLGRFRAQLLLLNGGMLVAMQVIYFADLHWPHHHSDLQAWLTLGAWTFLVLAMLAVLLTGGGYGYGKEVRALVNDESAMANRDAALRLGFATANFAALFIFLLSHLHRVNGQFAAHVIITVSLASALIRFGLLEHKAHNLG